MANKSMMTGMLGTYLAAAELTSKDFIVTVTSRNARGADLLVADQAYRRTWSIQVKTNRKAASFWLLNKNYAEIKSPTHVYLFINLRGDQRPDYYVVPSSVVAKKGTTTPPRSGGSIWYAFWRDDAEKYREGWRVFGAGADETFRMVWLKNPCTVSAGNSAGSFRGAGRGGNQCIRVVKCVVIKGSKNKSD